MTTRTTPKPPTLAELEKEHADLMREVLIGQEGGLRRLARQCQHNRASDGTLAGPICLAPAVLCEEHGGHDGCAIPASAVDVEALRAVVAAAQAYSDVTLIPSAQRPEIAAPTCEEHERLIDALARLATTGKEKT